MVSAWVVSWREIVVVPHSAGSESIIVLACASYATKANVFGSAFHGEWIPWCVYIVASLTTWTNATRISKKSVLSANTPTPGVVAACAAGACLCMLCETIHTRAESE